MEQCCLDIVLDHRWHPRMLRHGQSASGRRDERTRYHSFNNRTPIRQVLSHLVGLHDIPDYGEELCEIAWAQIYDGTTVHLNKRRGRIKDCNTNNILDESK